MSEPDRKSWNGSPKNTAVVGLITLAALVLGIVINEQPLSFPNLALAVTLALAVMAIFRWRWKD